MYYSQRENTSPGKTFLSGISVSIHMAINLGSEPETLCCLRAPTVGSVSPLSPQQGKEPSPSNSLMCWHLPLRPLVKCHACSLEAEPYAVEYTSVSCQALKHVRTPRSGREMHSIPERFPRKSCLCLLFIY